MSNKTLNKKNMKLPEIKDIKFFFSLHRVCVIKVFLLLVQSVIKKRTCSLYKCAETLSGTACFESKYKRLLRFFQIKSPFSFCLCVGYLIVSIVMNLPFFAETVYLAMDRTNWKIGKHNINPLFIGLVLPNKVFVPLIWIPLDKRGNSNQSERIDLLSTFLSMWTLNLSGKQFVLLADREFVGDKWLTWLKNNAFSFVIRLRINMYLDIIATTLGKPKDKMEHYICRQIRKNKFFVCPIIINGLELYYIAVANTKTGTKDKFVCFISDKADAAWAKESYDKRWKIEVFFKHVKSNGFNLEDMNLIDLDKIRLMMSIVAFAYVLCLKEGIQQDTLKPIALKKDKKGKTWLSVSFFRHGYRYIEQLFKELSDLVIYIIQNLDLIIKPNMVLIKKMAIPKFKSVQ